MSELLTELEYEELMLERVRQRFMSVDPFRETEHEDFYFIAQNKRAYKEFFGKYLCFGSPSSSIGDEEFIAVLRSMILELTKFEKYHWLVEKIIQTINQRGKVVTIITTSNEGVITGYQYPFIDFEQENKYPDIIVDTLGEISIPLKESSRASVSTAGRLPFKNKRETIV